MPLLKISTSYPSLSATQKQAFQQNGTSIIAEEIGKSPEFVMVLIESGVSMSFRGSKDDHAAYLEIKNVGTLSPDVTQQLTHRLTELIQQTISINPDRCYLEFQESERHLWGWNGKTFAR